jgi:transposase-like protein
MDEKIFAGIKEKAINQMLDEWVPDADRKERVAMATFMEQFLESVMNSERIIHLEDNDDDKGNGHYRRILASALGKLRLDVPRTRSGDFRPKILPDKYQRTTADYNALLESLAENSCSPNHIGRVLAGLDLPYSEEQMQIIKQRLIDRLNDFKTQQLSSDAFALIIDAYHTRMKENTRVKETVVYVVLSISLDGQKEIAGFYPIVGSETKTDWLIIFNDLVNRGLSRFLIMISDDFPGLTDAVNAVFPKSDHQLCCVHLIRNVRRQMGKSDASIFIRKFRLILSASDCFDDAKEKFVILLKEFQKKYPSFINPIIEKIDHYVIYKKYPEQIRKFIYTTNAAENFNRQIDDIRVTNGGYFQSREILEIDLFLLQERLRNDKWRHPNPIIAGERYNIHQLFNLRFFQTIKESQTHNS